VATLQLEVARRILANAGDPSYGILTLLLQLRYRPGDHFRIPASCFYPAPDVDSACLVLERRSRPLLDGEQAAAFKRVVKRAFSQRRKMMLKLLREEWPGAQLADVFGRLGLSPQTRAEAVSLEQFVRLTEELTAT
jgi:16S rRNA (adenine1518-N6/adenine1519-N6)-dimethyltransferase